MPTAIKIHFSDEIRRVGISYFDDSQDWTSFVPKIYALFEKPVPSQLPKIQYLDNEGDKITISSTEELQEALTIPGLSTLNLFVVVPTPTTRQHRPSPSRCFEGIPATVMASFQDVGEEFEGLLGLAREAVGGDELHMLFGNQGLAIFLESEGGIKLLQYLQDHPACMPTLENTAAQIIASFGALPFVGVSKINNVMLELMTAAEKMPAYKQTLLQLARAVAGPGRSVFGQDQILLYNSACIESIMENVDLAVALLDQALAAGYSNFEHIFQDADLENLRKCAKFDEIITTAMAAAQNQDQQREPPKPTPQQQQKTNDEKMLEDVLSQFETFGKQMDAAFKDMSTQFSQSATQAQTQQKQQPPENPMQWLNGVVQALGPTMQQLAGVVNTAATQATQQATAAATAANLATPQSAPQAFFDSFLGANATRNNTQQQQPATAPNQQQASETTVGATPGAPPSSQEDEPTRTVVSPQQEQQQPAVVEQPTEVANDDDDIQSVHDDDEDEEVVIEEVAEEDEGEVPAPQPTAVAPKPKYTEATTKKIALLKDMGFAKSEEEIAGMLDANNGDVQAVLGLLLN
eukprot:TRINITY_DN77136_c0_g1_i1.p1 TRINITY_DN77136_c0_g1~~TRINITY_DN77136_c0_g1_i1.p1  ORF type:complete len:606 (-),score=163.03 TRINITY_DN77136_c0_g1_i1:109-1842(-)